MPKKKTAQDKLKDLGTTLHGQIKKGQNPEVELALRGIGNVSYDETKRKLKLGDKTQKRQFFNTGHAKKFMQTLEMAKIAKTLLDVAKHSTLRDVYYMAKRTIPNSKTDIVDEQTESDKAIEDLELTLDTTREELNINADKKGTVSGKVVIEDSGDTIDWSKMGSGGWSIPSNVENIKFKKVSAKYIIYMEKAAVWERLHEDKFWEKHNCIIMASQGQTTRGIRRLLSRLSEEYKLPIYVLADNDPWGYYIYSVLKFGSISLAHMTETLAIPKAKFIGVTTQDIENYDLKKHFIKFKDVDFTRLKQIAEYDWFKNNKPWQKEFKAMKKNGAKVEIQSLSSRGITFISDVYLPEKIKKKDFLD